jgi:peroxiredoxin
MTTRRSLRIWSTILLLAVLLCFPNIVWADKPENTNLWKCADLLDEQTKSSLDSQEQFFASLFQLPSEYKQASETQKARLINQWLKELQGNNYEKITESAAYLGIVKAKEAAEPLEKLLAAGRGGGRLRWVCTRSLGQTGENSSIPLLINLLDNQNKETRVYARVALAEITGVYFGDDKEKWKNWQSGSPPQLCTLTECKIDESDSKTADIRKSFSRDRLDFCLPDTHGRIVDSQDYVDVPVLIMSGSCWCGGCQQDAEPLRKIAADYADKGLATIRTVAGDNELAALDFQKHYRLPFVQLLDTNRSFENRYNPDGWTFLMLADRDGKIVYKVNGPHEKDWIELKGILNRMFSSTIPNKTIIRDGVAYSPATLQRSEETEKQRICERFPSITCGTDGQVYVVFTTNRNGSSDVFIRAFDGCEWSKDIPIVATAADEYDGTILVDKQGHIWVCWTSNAGGRNYDIFIMSFTNFSHVGTPTRLTNSDDDAMHPRMACDEKGRVWITYYKWRKMGRYSRDKEIYVRVFENGKWSDELQVSPEDVPEYEDHSDPAITTRRNEAIICWSWDFHQPDGYTKDVRDPTIFLQSIGRNVGDTLRLCCKKPVVISSMKIDSTPAIGLDNNGGIWCAWDSLSWDNNLKSFRKDICIREGEISLKRRRKEAQELCRSMANVCTPSFATSPNNPLALLWSETQDGTRWLLKKSVLYNSNNDWSNPEIIDSEGRPRFCSAAYDSENRLWTAYSVETAKGREIVVKNLSEDGQKLNSLDNDAVLHSDSNRNIEAVKKLRQEIDEKYSYRDLRGVDWDRSFKIYTPRLEKAKTPQEFAELAAKMLLNAKDMHLWVKIDGETIGGFSRNINRNYNIDTLKKEVPRWRDLSGYVSIGQFPDGIGYILIKSWQKDEGQVLEPALTAIRDLSKNSALIIDVRPNGGGSEPFAEKVAGCFVNQPVVYAKHVYRDINTQTGWGQVQERTLKPNPDITIYQGKVAVLMGQANLSSCEAFLLMMKQVPSCKLIGERSYGSSGNPKPYDLGNEVTVWLPSWKALRPDGSCFEGQGIEPDITVRANERQLREKDLILESAIRCLKNNF